jgi:hypothetical protein
MNLSGACGNPLQKYRAVEVCLLEVQYPRVVYLIGKGTVKEWSLPQY